MRFGEQLSNSLIRQYSYYYISYDDLKQYIQINLKDNNNIWNQDLETQFLTNLELELDKVYSFCKVKNSELERRLKDAQEQSQLLITNNNNTTINNNNIDDTNFLLLEQELSDIIADVHDLAKFSRLNYTGFQKIIKKHDKLTNFILKPIFQVRLDAKPFFKENYEDLVIKLSQLYDLVRNRGNPIKGDSSAGGKQQNFVRQTTKYWVHPDNITELKLIILKHLPVLVFNPNKEFEKEDSAITSIYYDNENLDLYYGRLRKDEGAEAHRLRWYGGMSSDTIFIERKTHREDWTGEKSVKARFALKEKYINDFMKGNYTAHQAFEKMRLDRKKSIKEIESLESLAIETQYTILKKKLRPVVRSFYNRTAFQLPGDARVRISLDTELTMVREDNFDGINRTKGNWRRMDIGVDWPFKQLPEKDVCRFPYAVLEVKLQTQLGQQPPEWVRELVGSHLVEPVPKFSKFIHGIATLLNNKVDLIPFWLPQMDVDIRKPQIQSNINITRPNRDEHDDDDDEDDEDDAALVDAMLRNSHPARGNLLDDEEAVGSSSYGAINNNTQQQNNNTNNNFENQTLPSVNASFYRNKINESNNVISRSYYKTLSFFDHYFNGDQITKIPKGTEFDTRITAPPGKAICVPVRIEPKVYFATERTFLSWLSISIILGGVSTTLMTYGTEVTMIASLGFFLSAIYTIIHATKMYAKRVMDIRLKRASNYEDEWGPRWICGLLLASVLFSLYCNLEL